MVKPGDCARLLQKLLPKALHRLASGTRAQRDMRGLGIASAHLLHEKLLDGHLPTQRHLFGQIRDAEATLAQHTHYPIFALLKKGA